MKKNTITIVLFTALVFWLTALIGSGALADPPSKRMPAVKPAYTYVTEHVQKDRIIVKFQEGAAVRLRAGKHVSLKGTDLSAFHALLKNYPGATVHRLFSRTEEELDREKEAAEQHSGWQLADLNLYYVIALHPGISVPEVEALVNALNALEVIEIAYPDVNDALPFADIPPTTPNFQPNQGYLSPAPQGIDALYAWGFPGGDGAGTKFIDVEYGWHLTHEDLKTPFFQAGINNDGDTPSIYFANSYHGTAVLGEVIAQRNSYGMTGIAPAANFGISSAHQSSTESSTAQAINAAAAELGPGDVILVELQSTGPSTGEPCTCSCLVDPPNTTFVPVEYYQDRYDAIRAATARGIVVVEPAGNGTANLDHAVYNGVFNRAVRDSGAIMAAAGEVVHNAQIGQYVYTGKAACFTNYGSRIDVNAWGVAVHTTGGDGTLFKGDPASPDLNQYYTLNFGGTSGASPIVVGAVLSIQGYMQQLLGSKLDPLAMRTLLTQTGTPQSGLETRHIGPMPNLRTAFTRLQTNPPPAISDFTPAWALIGSSVTINGASLSGATQVTFNGIAASFSVLSPTQITATVPVGTTTGYIKVTTPGGTATSAQLFVPGPPPTITSFLPAGGPVGTVVTLSGTNLCVYQCGTPNQNTETQLTLNGTVIQPTSVTASAIQFTIPAGVTGGKFTVTTPGGTATSANTFTFYGLPTISFFNPLGGPIGTSVTINGSGFCNSQCLRLSGNTETVIKLNGVTITPSVLFPGVIQLTIPAGASTGKFTITTPGGTATSGDTFTVLGPPTISYYNPTSALPGTLVNVYGKNFCGIPCNPAETQLKLNGVSITTTSVSATNIQFTLPAGSTSGYLTVTTPLGTGSMYFIVQGVPQIIYFGPFIATTGTIVTIQGSYFCGIPCFASQTQVKLNGLLLPITDIFPGYLKVRIPAGATSGYLTVTTPAGTATSSGKLIIQQPPTISSFTPTSGPVGTLVDMNGFPFCGFPCDVTQIQVTLNGASVSLRAAFSGYLQLEIPPGATSGKFTVTTAVGSATSAQTFTVTP